MPELTQFDIHLWLGMCGHSAGLIDEEECLMTINGKKVILRGMPCCMDVFVKKCEEMGLPSKLGSWE